jgi:hypothetical protein
VFLSLKLISSIERGDGSRLNILITPNVLKVIYHKFETREETKTRYISAYKALLKSTYKLYIHSFVFEFQFRDQSPGVQKSTLVRYFNSLDFNVSYR